MGMPALSEPRRWTVEMLETLPDDGNRYECIDGELLVTPAPTSSHQLALGALHLRIAPYVKAMEVGVALLAPVDVIVDEWTRVQPDLSVIHRRIVGRDAPLDPSDLLLFVEVASPGTVRRDRGMKQRLYARMGVGEYWVLDVDARTIERWRAGVPDPEVESGVLSWRPPGAARALDLDLSAFFDDMLDLPDRLRITVNDGHD
jgi:Uma2 family endonuclease